MDYNLLTQQWDYTSSSSDESSPGMSIVEHARLDPAGARKQLLRGSWVLAPATLGTGVVMTVLTPSMYWVFVASPGGIAMLTAIVSALIIGYWLTLKIRSRMPAAPADDAGPIEHEQFITAIARSQTSLILSMLLTMTALIAYVLIPLLAAVLPLLATKA